MELERNQYMLALMPPDDLSSEIREIKKAFNEKYSGTASISPVHITLQEPFEMQSDFEEVLIKVLSPIAYYQKAFEVVLENFDFFPEDYVIYVKPEPNQELKLFQRNLISRLKKVELLNVKYTMRFNPHITVSTKDFPLELFEEAQNEYLDKHFRGKFNVLSFFLWKQVEGSWVVHHEFNFLAENRTDYYIDYVESPLGIIEITASDYGLITLSFIEKKPKSLNKKNIITDNTILQLSEFFSGDRKNFEIPIAPEGTDFQKAIWELLISIPYGEKISYQTLSKRHGNEKAIRAVGLANGKNPLPLIIPCHRVVGKDGKLVGYSGGMWRKQWLLEHEAKHSAIGQQMMFF